MGFWVFGIEAFCKRHKKEVRMTYLGEEDGIGTFECPACGEKWIVDLDKAYRMVECGFL